jgi:cation:H+ antiporter
MILASILFLAGLVLLVKGADWLVDGASSLAYRLGVTPLVIGLTIVAFGTSAPELVVNLVAAFSGNTEIAIGNIIGSNIANILLILGIAGCITPLIVKKNTAWKEIPFALLALLLVLVFVSDRLFTGRLTNSIDRIDGIALLTFFLFFLYYTYGIAKSRKGEVEVKQEPIIPIAIKIVGGLSFLIIGGKLSVDGAIDIATALGMSQRVIALSVIAIGTSLPELVTSAVAAYKRKVDIAVGNVIGSNIFNVFLILGITATLKPLPFLVGNFFDISIAIGATLLLFVALFVGRRHTVERWQSVGFILLYFIYLAGITLS